MPNTPNTTAPNRLSSIAIRTRLLKLGQPLAPFVIDALKSEFKNGLPEKSVVSVTSKIVSLSEKRVVPKSEISKKDLVKRESDRFLGEVGYGVFLTIKEGIFIPSAGIDESNAEGDFYILYPEQPFKAAQELWKALRDEFKVKELGVILTDSHTQPLRNGVTGIALSYWGFKGAASLVGEKDLFGRPFRMTQINAADALAVTSVFLMGEGTEQCPVAWVDGSKHSMLFFTDHTDPSELRISLDQDLYGPFFKSYAEVRD